MPRAKLTVDGVSPEEIKKMLRKDEKYMIGVRLYAVYQVAKGSVSREVAQFYNVSFKSVCNWVNQFNKYGIEGLQDNPKSGRKPQLSEEQMKEIKYVILKEPATKFNYNTATWTGPILINFILKKYGVEFKRAQIYNILNKLDLSYKKGKGKYPEADEQKRQEFIKNFKKNSKPRPKQM